MQADRPHQRLLRRLDAGAGARHGENREHDPDCWASNPLPDVEALVSDLRERAIEAISHPDGFSVDTCAALRHRVICDRERFLHVTGWTGPDQPSIDFHVGLDFRIGEMGGQTICHVSFSLWSAPPWSNHHRAPELVASTPEPQADHEWRTQAAVFEGVRDRCAVFIDQYFTTANLRVFGRPYHAPTFWTVVPWDDDRSPDQFLDDRGELVVPELATTFLGGASARAGLVAVSVLNRDTLALRRFVPDVPTREDSPTYLLFPTRALRGPRVPEQRASSTPGFPSDWADQEDEVRRTITSLTDIEAFVAAQLWEIETDLDIWDTHLEGYENAADRASRIWDGLANHLVISRGQDLAEVHRAIETVHQTLLQGVSDIDRIATLAAERAGQLGRLAEEIDERCAESFYETGIGDRVSISSSFTATGHFGVVAHRAGEMAEGARRVASNYRDILAAIGHAFDERRVRETDAIQRIGAYLAFALAGIGAVTAVDALFDELKITLDGGLAVSVLRIVIAFAAAVLLIGGGWAAFRMTRVGKLGSPTFRRVYRDLWQFLRATSTDRLNHVRSLIERRVHEPPHGAFLDLLLSLPDTAARDALVAEAEPKLAQLCRDLWTTSDTAEERTRVLARLSALCDKSPEIRRFVELNGLSHVVDRRNRYRARLWAVRDDALALDFCRLWDNIDPLPGDERITGEDVTVATAFAQAAAGHMPVEPGEPAIHHTHSQPRVWHFWARARRAERSRRRRDRRQLSAMAEKWSLRTLLLTERPREMYRYGLPQLTLMYRVAFALLDDERHANRYAVSFTDLRFVLGQFPRHGLRSVQTEALDRWLRLQVAAIEPPPAQGLIPPTARRAQALLDRVRTVGIRPGFGGYMISARREADRRRELFVQVCRTIDDHDRAMRTIGPTSPAP